MKGESDSEQMQNIHEVHTHLDTGPETGEKGPSPAQILENPLQKQKKNQNNKEKKTKRQTEGARGWGCVVGNRYSLSNAGLLNRQASL